MTKNDEDEPVDPRCPISKERQSLCNGGIEEGRVEIHLPLELPRQSEPKSRLSSCSSSRLSAKKLLIILVLLVMILVTSNLACYSHLKYIPSSLDVDIADLPNNNPQNVVCKALHGTFVNKGKDEEEESRNDMDKILLYGFAMPLIAIFLLVATVSAVSPDMAQNNHKTTSSASSGKDPPLTFLTLLFVLLPSLLIAFEPHFYQEYDSWKTAVHRLANPAGIAACFALSLFLIPVAKHSPLIKVFGLSFTQALFFHRISGWISFWYSLLHGLIYCLVYGLRGDSNLLKNVITALIPPGECWGWDIFWIHGMEERSCYGYWRNFTGTISLLAFIVLGITSHQRVRRKRYAIFVSIHIPAAWIMMIGAIAHFHFIGLFLIPNILYYFIVSVPEWIKHFAHSRLDKGPNVQSITWIADSGGCFQINLCRPESRFAHDQKLALQHGAVCKICVPEISSIWHPFSVIFGKDGKVALLIRPVGTFTTNLSNRLLPSDISGTVPEGSLDSRHSQDVEAKEANNLLPAPKVLVDGFYPAEYRWHERILHHHDSVLLLAGGVGIVPFLTLLPRLIEELTTSHPGKTPLRHLALHWYCREAGLVKFVNEKYHLKDLFDSTQVNGSLSVGDESEDPMQIHLKCYIHITSRRAGENDADGSESFQNCAHADFVVDAVTGLVHGDQGNVLSSHQPRNTTFTYQYMAEGKSWADSSSSNAILKCILFALASISSMLVHWLHYTGSGGRGVTMPLTYPLIIIVIISVCFGLVQLGLDRKSCGWVSCSRKFESVSRQDDANDVGNETLHTLPNIQGFQITRSLNIGSGRPSVTDVIGPLINAETPGAFFCGPSALRERIKKDIVKNRRQRHGMVSTALPCAFYDEHSEM